MKTCGLWRLKNCAKILKFHNAQFSYAANTHQNFQLQTEEKEVVTFNKSIKKKLYSRILENEEMKNLYSITSVTVSMNNVSWSKIELPSLQLLEWDCYTLPMQEAGEINDIPLLKAVREIKWKIPRSDLYVMESTVKIGSQHLSGIFVKAIIELFLSELKNDYLKPKLLFQKPFIVNCLYRLKIGGERVSAKAVVDQFVLESSVTPCNESYNRIPNSSSLIDLSEHKNYYYSFSIEKQESLSLAFLIALSFVNLLYLQCPKSITKLQNKSIVKMLNHSKHSKNIL